MLSPRTVSLALLLTALASGCTDLEHGVVVESTAARPHDARELEVLVNDYRAEQGLPPIPASEAMRAVAEAHVQDLEIHDPPLPCSLHSWSLDGPWSACCYEQERPDVPCMAHKPRELTAYTGDGYEIAVYFRSELRTLTPQLALSLWRESPAHHDVLLSRRDWAGRPWRAFGAAFSEHYAVIWFGHEPDPTPPSDNPRWNTP